MGGCADVRMPLSNFFTERNVCCTERPMYEHEHYAYIHSTLETHTDTRVCVCVVCFVSDRHSVRIENRRPLDQTNVSSMKKGHVIFEKLSNISGADREILFFVWLH